MYTITKHFEFCYAHRLYGYPGKCGNVHGHTARVEVHCQVEKLPATGMAIDFRELSNKIGGFIEENLDHRLILAKNDPIVAILKEIKEEVKVLESPPSAENLAELIYKAAKEAGLPVTKVSFWESPTSVASYSASSSH